MDIVNTLKNMRLLYVDDDKIALNVGKKLFSLYFKKVDTASSAKEAISKIENNRYDIVITDIVMPEMSGFDLAKEIKLNHPDITVIFLSAFFDTQTLLKAIDIGVDGFLIKPFDEKKFLDTMRNILKYKYELNFNKNLLKQYRDIVDENLIVSKTDLEGKITFVNDAFEKVSGFKKEELLGKPHNIVRHPDMKKEVFEDLWKTILSGKTWRGLIKNRKKNGESYYVDTVIKPIFDVDGNISEFIALRKEVTSYMTAEKLINDKLKIVKDAMLVLVKITNFKDMKLVYDEDVLSTYRIRLLKMIKRYLFEYFEDIEEYIVNEDILGFLIVDYDKHKDKIQEICEDILKAVVNKTLVVKGFEFYPLIKMSIAYGQHIYTNAMLGLEEIENSEELVIIANGLCIKKKEEVIKNMNMLKVVEDALTNDKVVAYFQPIFDNATGKVVKFEALVRIIDKDKILTPFFFLDIAKKAGLYGKITLKMLDNCFEVYNKYKIPLSINLSPSDIMRDFIKEKILSFLKEAKIKKGDITFEVLEDEVIRYPHLLKEFCENVIDLNATVAIDDFGSGYSNFSRVIELKADIVKLDGSIIKEVDKDKTKQNIVESIVHFAKKENIKTVAEFVENENILNTIKNLGVDCSQGYFYSPPIPSSEISKFL
jgi:PAS domain S-box-containing protein